MNSHTEISTTYYPEIIADNALFALDIAVGLVFKKTGLPISSAENERCIIAITMLFISFGGYFNRIIYLLIKDSATLGNYDSLKATLYEVARLEGLFGEHKTKSSQKLIDHFEEIMVLRNAIAHGHLYETKRDRSRHLHVANNFILDGSNHKYTKYTNLNTYRTKNLKLHVIPSEIGISDLYKILKLWNQIYKRLNKLHGEKARLEGYCISDYKSHMIINGENKKAKALEDFLARDDGSFSKLLERFDSKRPKASKLAVP